MKRYFMVIIILTLFLIGCNNQKTNKTIESTTWKQIVNKEWSNLDIWAGSGFNFYEEDNIGYCVFMVYGSGVPVMYDYTSTATIQEDGVILITVPENIQSGYIQDVENETNKLVEVKLKFENNIIKLGDKEFAATSEDFFHKIMKKTE